MNPLKPLTSEQQKLVQDHLPMIDHFLLKQGFIHNYKIHNYDPRDLFQAGAEGLCIGAQRFDPNRGFTFSTYANIWFKSYIFEECTRNSVVCISRQLRRIINKIKMHQLYHPKASIQQSIEAFEKSKSRPISPGFKQYILKKQNIRSKKFYKEFPKK